MFFILILHRDSAHIVILRFKKKHKEKSAVFDWLRWLLYYLMNDRKSEVIIITSSFKEMINFLTKLSFKILSVNLLREFNFLIKKNLSI